MYIENDDQDVRSISGIVFSECARNANDATKPFSVDILPLAFFGSRDENEEISTVWKSVWDDLCAGASNNATKLYGQEIVELSCQIVTNSPSWPIKKQVGKTFMDLCEILDVGFEKFMPTVVPVLIEALSGRTWEGKESVLQALTQACIMCKTWVVANNPILLEVVKVGTREMRKNNKAYKRFSLDFVSLMIDELNVDRFEEVCFVF
jgi:proteasome component ECM29